MDGTHAEMYKSQNIQQEVKIPDTFSSKMFGSEKVCLLLYIAFTDLMCLCLEYTFKSVNVLMQHTCNLEDTYILALHTKR